MPPPPSKTAASAVVTVTAAASSELPPTKPPVQQQQQQQQQPQAYARHPAFTSNRLGGLRSPGGSESSGGSSSGRGFQVDRPMAGVLVIGGILLFVTMSLTAAVIVFCKKRNTVFVLQKSDENSSTLPGGADNDEDDDDEDSSLELADILADLDASNWGSSYGDLSLGGLDGGYSQLALTAELPQLLVRVDVGSGQRRVVSLQAAADNTDAGVLSNRHAIRDSCQSSLRSLRTSTGGTTTTLGRCRDSEGARTLAAALLSPCRRGELGYAGTPVPGAPAVSCLVRSQTCSAAVGGQPSATAAAAAAATAALDAAAEQLGGSDEDDEVVTMAATEAMTLMADSAEANDQQATSQL